MDNNSGINIEALRKGTLCHEDWFVGGKRLHFRAARGKKALPFDTQINKRIFDKPNIKTVIWGGA